MPEWLPEYLSSTISPEVKRLLRRVSPETRARAKRALAVFNYRLMFGHEVRLEETVELANANAAVNAELEAWRQRQAKGPTTHHNPAPAGASVKGTRYD